MKKLIIITLPLLLVAGCAGLDAKTASGFCVTSAGWNGSPVVAVGCNREKGNTGGGITVDCGGQYKVTCNDIEKTVPAPASKPVLVPGLAPVVK